MKKPVLLSAFGVAAVTAFAVDTVVEEVEIVADTNIVVNIGDTLKIEYLHGANSNVVTKSGAGKLIVATTGTNVWFDVVAGTLASARPATLPSSGEFVPDFRVDASLTNTFTFASKNGTNFVKTVTDANGGARTATTWGGWLNPYFTGETFNGLQVLDFGLFYKYSRDAVYGAMFALSPSMNVGEFFYVWKDRDDVIDADPLGGTEFNGPCVLGNNPSFWTRGTGGLGMGFSFYSVGMGDTVKTGISLDGEHKAYSERVPRGFHLMHNRFAENKRVGFSVLGYSVDYGGGFVLAEMLAYSNQLSVAGAARVEAQLRSKWFGAKLCGVTLREGATLDVSAVKFDIRLLNVAGPANLIGSSNLSVKALSFNSSNFVVSGTCVIDGTLSSETPDLSFAGDAVVSVSATSRVPCVVSGTGRLVKSGVGVLKIADPDMTNLTVEAGTLSVSPLYVRNSDYHLDAAQAATINWAFSGEKKLISAWYDCEDPSKSFKPTTWRKPGYDDSRLIRAPYVTENAVGTMPMVDFGTYANVNHPDGWGASLEGSPTISDDNGAHDVFCVWKDYPEVKSYAYSYPATPFPGPSFFGYQYHWNRGKGGNGVGFSVHATGCPYNMVYPYNTGRVYVDGVEVKGDNFPVGDGVHVLAQRTDTNDGKPGTPLQSIGGNWMDTAVNSEGASVKGIFGGCLVGEVLAFRTYLSDRMRFRINDTLVGKWLGGTNIWNYGTVEVATGATLDHPYADLRAVELRLAGKVVAKSVKASLLEITGAAAEVDGKLEFAHDGTLALAYDAGTESFPIMTATSVEMSGSGAVTISGIDPLPRAGSEFKIVDSDAVTGVGLTWAVPQLYGSGVRACLTAKSDGLYLGFESGGTVIIFK